MLALQAHLNALLHRQEKTEQLIQTVRNTIQHLKGTIKMTDQEMFYGLSFVKQAAPSSPYFEAEQLVAKSVRKPTTKRKPPSFYDGIKSVMGPILDQLAQCLEQGRGSSAPEVQKLIGQHYEVMSMHCDLSPKVYRAYAQLYREHPEFQKQLSSVHPQLPAVMAEAMLVFADRHA